MQISISNSIGGLMPSIVYVKKLIKAFKARVLSYPNSIFEADLCLDYTLTDLNDIGLLKQASLIVTPNAYNEGVLYDVVPNTTLGDMNVVRATTGTRVNEQGLIEVVPRNLISYSEDVTNTDWFVTAAGTGTNPVITANYTTSPTGTNNADRVQFSNVGGSGSTSNYSLLGKFPLALSSTGTATVYLKSLTSSNQNVLCYWGAGQGTVFVVTPQWQRFTLSNLSVSDAANFFIGTRGGNSSFASGGDATLDIAVWGAQLENFATATEYFPTTTRLNIPRIDYTNGSCPSLLVEPQRTNFYPYSQQLNQWSILGVITVTENNEISPDGTQNADRAQFTSSTDLLYRSGTGLAGSNTLTVYAKAKSGTSQNFRFFGNGGLTYSSNQVATNQWQRFTFTYTYSAQTAGLAGATTGASDVLFYGFQHEIGSYPTSYIPTVASSVTRNADVISKTGISSLIGQTEGTFFLDIKNIRNEASYKVFTLSNSANTSYLVVGYSATTNKLYIEFLIGSSVINIEPTINKINGNKIAFVYANGIQKIFVNGINIYSNTLSITANGWSVFKSSYYTGSSIFNGNINSIQLYKTALTDQKCITLTTL